jgi:hypothetical protein
MTKKLRISPIVLGIIGLLAALIYVYAFINERDVIRLVMSDQFHQRHYRTDGSIAKTVFIAQVQYIRPWGWRSQQIDTDILESLRSQIDTATVHLRPLSDAVQKEDLSSPFSIGYYDPTTGRRGEAITAGPVTWIHPFKVRVIVNTYYGILSSSLQTIELKLGPSGWCIVQTVPKSISSASACPPNKRPVPIFDRD